MATNSTSTSARQYREDVSDVIQKKISLLRSQEHRISALELELNDLREQHNRLEQELEPYCLQYRATRQISAFPSTINDLCPIHHLPDELLYSIFRLRFQAPYDNHQRSIGTLLFVCKRWYTLIMGSPKFWSTIRVGDPFELFDLVNRRPRISYFDSCLSRSRGLPLDMEVCFENFDEMSYIKEEPFQHAEAIINRCDYDALADQIYGQDWNFGSPRFYEEFDHFFDRLFGDKGQHLERCHSLTLKLPNYVEVADIICSRMADHVSNLTSLKILYGPFSWPVKDALSRVDLPKVSDLMIGPSYGEDPISVSHLSLSPTVLERIKINVENILYLEGLSSFKYLRSLELVCWVEFSPQADEVAATPLFSVQLPYLDSLSLVGLYIHLRKIHFEFPSLQALSLRPGNRHQRLPAALSSRNVEWCLRDDIIRGINQEPEILIPLFEDVFLLSKTIQRVTIPWSIKDAVLELVGQYQKRRQIPSLSHIVLERAGHASQVIEVGRLS